MHTLVHGSAGLVIPSSRLGSDVRWSPSLASLAIPGLCHDSSAVCRLCSAASRSSAQRSQHSADRLFSLSHSHQSQHFSHSLPLSRSRCRSSFPSFPASFTGSESMSAPSTSSSEGNSGDNLLFDTDYEYRDVQIVKDALAVANEFIASGRFIAALLASLIPLADSAGDDPIRRLSRAGIVAELTCRLMDATERAQLTAGITFIVSHTQLKIIGGRTPFLMETRLTTDGSLVLVNQHWVASLKNGSFGGADDANLRASRVGLHSTLLIIKFIHSFCHALTHFLIELVWDMDMSARQDAAAAAAPSTIATSLSSSQQVRVGSSPVSPPAHGLAWPTTKGHMHSTPPTMGTQRVVEIRQRGRLPSSKTQSSLQGDFGYWIEEILFGFRINCLPPPPHHLTTLTGTRILSEGQPVHFTVADAGNAVISPTALRAVARSASMRLTSLRLTVANGHVYEIPAGGLGEERPSKRQKTLMRATVIQTDLSTSLPDSPTEEEEGEESSEDDDDDEGPVWCIVKH